MNKIYYIASCDLPKNHKSLPKGNNLVFRDIKQTALTEEELEEMYLLSNSYEVLVKSPIV
jgi:arsenate reductase